MAADYEPPSFSLGFDFGFESELQTAPIDSDHEIQPQVEPPRALKRLKRGLPTTPFWNIEDDIEEFSSPEDSVQDVHRPTQYQTSCSSSKVPLRGSGVLTSQLSYPSIGRKRNHISDVPASVSSEASRKEFVFPKLTTSPLRRFQLIDSDSDDPSVSHTVSRVDPKVNSSSKKKQHTNPGHSATTSGTNNNASTSMPEDVDLWRNFSPVKKFNIPTPALDEACQEYFQSVKDKTTQNLERNAYLHTNKNFHETTPSGQDVEQLWNVADPLPPAHHYFFHDDPNIRKLVCNRLPNFSPLCAVSVGGNQQNGASVIDYMGQFSNGEASKQNVNQRQNISNISNVEVLDGSGNWVNPKGKATQKGKRSVNKGRNKSVTSNTGNLEHASGNWVEPKTNARKKRTQANAQSSGEWCTPSQSGEASGQAGGHWYTGPGRMKVYVSKTGKESTGRAAYRLYTKESGKRPVKTRKGKAKK